LEEALRDGIPPEDQAKTYYFMGNKYILDDYNFQSSYNSYKKALTIRKTLNVSSESDEEKKIVWQHAYDMMAMVARKIKPDNVDEAIRLYKEVIEFTDHPTIHLSIGVLYDNEQNNTEKAHYHWKYIVNNEVKLNKYKDYYEIRELAKENLNIENKKSSKKSGCFIATAIYGDMLAPEVVSLRQYRDSFLNCSKTGRVFIELYYYISPSLARFIGKRAVLKGVIRKSIFDPLVYLIKKHYTNLKS